MQTKLQIMDATGHTELLYSVDEKEALANAEAAFNEAVTSGGMMAFAFGPGETIPRPILDGKLPTEDVERVIVSQPLVAG